MKFKLFIAIAFLAIGLQSCSMPSTLTPGRSRMCDDVHHALVVATLVDGRVSDPNDPYDESAKQREDYPIDTSMNSRHLYALADRIGESGLFDTVLVAGDSVPQNAYKLNCKVLSYGAKSGPSIGTFLPFAIYMPVGIILYSAGVLGTGPIGLFLALAPGLAGLIAPLVQGYQYDHSYTAKAYFKLQDQNNNRLLADTAGFTYSDLYTEAFTQSSWQGNTREITDYSWDVPGITGQQLQQCWQRMADTCIKKMDRALHKN